MSPRFGNRIQEISPAGIKQPLALSSSSVTVPLQRPRKNLIPIVLRRLLLTDKNGSCCSFSRVPTHSAAKGIWLNWRGSFAAQVHGPLLSAGNDRDNPTLRPFGVLENYKKRRSKRDAIKPRS